MNLINSYHIFKLNSPLISRRNNHENTNNDEIFPADGAHPYKRDLKEVDFHLLDTGHFALEEDSEVITERIRRFLGEKTENQ